MQTKVVSKKRCLFLLPVVLLTFLNQLAFGQQGRHNQLIKIGAFCYPSEYRYNGFSVHFEIENSLSRRKSLAVGPRVDFINIRNGDPALLLGYSLKLFPFFSTQKVQNRGLFFAIAPVFMPKIIDVSNRRFGPGVSGLLGYQHIFHDDISLSVEGSWTYLRDISKYSAQFNSDRTYVYLYANVKLGVRLSRWLNSRDSSLQRNIEN